MSRKEKPKELLLAKQKLQKVIADLDGHVGTGYGLEERTPQWLLFVWSDDPKCHEVLPKEVDGFKVVKRSIPVAQ